MYPWLSWNSLCGPGWPQIGRDSPASASAGIKGVHPSLFLISNRLLDTSIWNSEGSFAGDGWEPENLGTQTVVAWAQKGLSEEIS